MTRSSSSSSSLNRPVSSRLDRFWRQNGMATVGGLAMLLVVAVAVLAPWVAPHDPIEANFDKRLVPPCWDYPLGTDDLGRDILSRVIWGAQISLVVGLLSVGTASAAGMTFGLVAAFKGGTVDTAIMRMMDVLMCFPEIVLAIAIVAALGPGLWSAIIAIGIVSTPIFARTVRAPALSEMHREYIEAARSIGASDLRLLVRHLLPNCTSIIIVRATVSLGYAILTEATLSFLGLGVPPPSPSWGRMLNEGRAFMGTSPWLTAFPGIAIAITVLGINLLGDGLRDRFDPRLRRN